MPSASTHAENKERIISFIKTKGPSIPVQIARALAITPLFASAFLSELYNEGRLKMSYLRVGSSPLYYISGQESQLQNFIQYLNSKEKEAFLLIEKDKILEDDNQLPAIRVALRSIKDFAVPFKQKLDNKEKIFWRFYLVSENEVTEILEPRQTLEETVQPQITIQQAPAEKEIEPQIEVQTPIIEQAPPQLISTSQTESINLQTAILNYLNVKKIEHLETMIDKKKEYSAKVKLDTILGKQEYLLIAKDKKKLTEKDLQSALEKARDEKMPALLISLGILDKKAIEFQKAWKNFLKIEKLS